MKVLFLPDTGMPDFLQDVVFHGLHSLLGDDVVEWPPLPRYRGGEDVTAARFPFLVFDLPPHSGGSLDELVGWADAIVMPSLRDGALPQVRAALGKKPTAFLDGEDHPYVRAIRSQVDLYFKRETLVSSRALRARMPLRRLYHVARGRGDGRDPLRRQVAVAHTDNVIPLPFGIIDVGFRPSVEKEFDVAFMARPTSPERERVLADLDRLGLRVVTGGDRRWEDYMKVLGRSRIGISVRGLGFDTMRYWEIPYAGAALYAERPQIVVPNNFAWGREAIFASLDELVEIAAGRLGGDIEAIGIAGREAVLARHTSLDRARTVLERLEPLVRRRT